MEKFPKYLIAPLQRGDAILFTGAGFSLGATKADGQSVLDSEKLIEFLLDSASLSDDPDSYDLKGAYEAACGIKGENNVKLLLRSEFSNCSPSSYHKNVLSYPWLRIYSTNIDDVIERAFPEVADGRVIHPLNGTGPPIQFTDSPQSLDYVKLHGTADGQSSLVFSSESYAVIMQQNRAYWLDKFGVDFRNKHIIFVGTNLSDVDLWFYMVTHVPNLRERPSSLLVSPHVPEGKRLALERLNIQVLQCTTEEFSDILRRDVGNPQSIEQIFENLLPLTSKQPFYSDISIAEKADLVDVYAPVRDLLNRAQSSDTVHSRFFLGAQPTWYDIFNECDAERDFLGEAVEFPSSEKAQNGLIIFGPAGTGKSTLLMRIAERLSRDEVHCYWFNQNRRFDASMVNRIISVAKKKVYLFIDNIHLFWRQLEPLLRVNEVENNGSIFIYGACRTYDFPDIRAIVRPHGFEMRRLDKISNKEIPRIIDKLDENKMLGTLAGLSFKMQHREFEIRAQKQLLVALLEATRGDDFTKILEDEYNRIQDQSLRLAYLAIASIHRKRIAMPQHLLHGCMRELSVEFDSVKLKQLEDIILGIGPEAIPGEGFTTRHPVIADYIFSQAADLNDRKEILRAVLTAIAPGALADARHLESKFEGRSGSDYAIYRSLITYESVLEAVKNRQEVENVYHSISSAYEKDPHYWLHYGTVCTFLGDYDRAENYFNQSVSIFEFPYAHHQMGRMFLIKILEHAKSNIEGKVYFERAYEELQPLLHNRATREYAVHTLLDLLVKVSVKWGRNKVFDEEILRDLCEKTWNDPELLAYRRLKKALKNAVTYLKTDVTFPRFDH